jgi:hypothetical protein
VIAEKKAEFRSLFAEFAKAYLTTPQGEEHLRFYAEGRSRGLANLTLIRTAAKQGQDVTDGVLRGLLPHTNSAAHRASGAWVHIAPAVQGDIKEWFESVGWTKADDWPQIATAILSLASRCADDPGSLEAACDEFSALHYTTGLQTGLLTPILNAVDPDAFLIVNKSRKVINHFTGSHFKQALTNYPEINKAGRAFNSEMSTEMHQLSGGDARPSDLFDMFCDWLVAVRKYEPVVGGGGEKKIRTEDSEVIVTVPDASSEKSESVSAEANAKPRQSYQIQAALAHIGTKMGFRIWVPRSDRQNILALIPEEKRSHFIDELPLNYDDLTLKTIEQIDVIWLKRRSIARAFEVEHTTAIHSGLLRMADLLALQPNMDIRLHIAASIDRRAKVRQEILRPTFSLLERGPLYRMCSFLSYSAVEEMNALPNLEYMTRGSIVEKYAEAFVPDEDDL